MRMKVYNRLNKIKFHIVYSFYNLREFLLGFFLRESSLIFEKDKFYLFEIRENAKFFFEKIFNEIFYTNISNTKSFYFLNSVLSDEVLDNLNSQLIYINCKEVPKYFFVNLINNIYQPIKKILNSNWKCVQIRAWITKKKSNRMVGPLKFHTDGMPNSVYKIMIYPEAINLKNGSIEIENSGILISKTSCALLFKNSMLLHRGVPGEDIDRPVIELTIVKNLFFNNDCRIGEPNSVLPILIF